MLATPGKLFSAPGWLYELKYDGFRCLVCKRGEVVRLESRNGRDLGACFPELVAEVSRLSGDLVLDAELVICDEIGRPQWDRLKRRHALRRADRIREAAASDPAALFAFDLLELRGVDYRPYPLRLRKAVLRDLLKQAARVRCVSHFENSHAEVWALAVQLELEGIVAKCAESPYVAGRTTSWQKVKTDAGVQRQRNRRPR